MTDARWRTVPLPARQKMTATERVQHEANGTSLLAALLASVQPIVETAAAHAAPAQTVVVITSSPLTVTVEHRDGQDVCQRTYSAKGTEPIANALGEFVTSGMNVVTLTVQSRKRVLGLLEDGAIIIVRLHVDYAYAEAYLVTGRRAVKLFALSGNGPAH